MRNLLLRFFINAFAIGVIVSGIFPGIRISGNTLPTLVVVALVFGLINTFIKPIIQLVTCPIVLLTFGLFLFVINGVMLYATAFISDWISRNVGVGGSLMIDHLGWAIVGAVITTLVVLVLERILGVNEKRVVVKRVEIHEVAARSRQRIDEDWDRALDSGTDPRFDPPRRPAPPQQYPQQPPPQYPPQQYPPQQPPPQYPPQQYPPQQPPPQYPPQQGGYQPPPQYPPQQPPPQYPPPTPPPRPQRPAPGFGDDLIDPNTGRPRTR
jgi:uncharacterized membrane protein YvlD (DUF360 family)